MMYWGLSKKAEEKDDTHVKSPFYMTSGITSYYRRLALSALLEIPTFPTFYETIKIDEIFWISTCQLCRPDTYD